MLKINHDYIEYNGKPVASLHRISTPDFYDLRDTIEESGQLAIDMESGKYCLHSCYDELKRDKEDYESKCQNAQYALERLLSDIEHVLEQAENEALKLVADDLESALQELRG